MAGSRNLVLLAAPAVTEEPLPGADREALPLAHRVEMAVAHRVAVHRAVALVVHRVVAQGDHVLLARNPVTIAGHPEALPVDAVKAVKTMCRRRLRWKN